MGTIYLAVAEGLADFRKLLVVKELRRDLSANPRFVEMFFDEAKLAARLNHPNVVQTIEAGQEDDRYFLSMEFLDGQPYSAIWQGAGQFPQVPLLIRLKILCEALAGLHYAHTLTEYDGTSLQIVHRDVSPQNIFVTYDGQVKVVDFGIAKAAVSTATTSPGMFKGKFGYAAPEQVLGHDVDARTDIFAMGVLLWETLTMQRFSDSTVTREAVATRLAGREPRASELQLKVDRRLAAICDRALAIDPNARFSSADEFRVVLEDYLAQTEQRVDTSSVKHVLADKFAAERRVVHRLIDRYIKHGALEESHVRTTVLGSEAGNNHPTQVTDLSQYVRTTANETVISSIAPELSGSTGAPSRGGRSRRTLAGSALAIIAALGVTFGLLQLSSNKDTAAPPRPAETVAAESKLTRPATASAPASPQPRAALAARAVTPAEQAQQSARARPPAAAVQVTLAAPAGGARPTSHRSLRARMSAAVASPNAVEQPAQPPAEVAPVHVEPAPPDPPAKVSVGVDLNGVRDSYQHRAIDTDL
jgi:serine/threonine-protein kinase